MREALSQRPPACWGHAVLRRPAQQVGGLPRHDQPAIPGEHILRKIRVDGEIQCIGIVTVVMPFAVGLEVGEAGFDFNAHKAAIGPQRENVGAAVVVEPNLVELGPSQRQAEPTGGAPDAGGALRRGERNQGSKASMAWANATSLADRPPASWVVSVMSTLFQTLDHSG